MTPGVLLLVLVLGGLGLIFAEIFLPTHGTLGVLGFMGILAAIFVCFYINAWFGLVALIVVAVASPFAFNMAIELYQRTPVGRKMILQNDPQRPAAPPAVHIGQMGIARTEMRPSGEVEFDTLRLEAMSESGIIAAGQMVRVTGIVDGRPRVRAVDSVLSAGNNPRSNKV